MKLLNILHLEDDPTDAKLIRLMLEEEGLEVDITVVDSREKFVAALHEGPPDVILADYSLPSYDGLSALRLVREDYPFLPFILISGALGEELAVESLKHGATDYVLKQGLHRLVPALKRALEEAELHRSKQKAEELAHLLTTVIEQMNEAVVITDVEGIIQYANPSFERISGYSPSDVIGESPDILNSGKQDANFYDEMWQTILGGDVWRGRFVNKRKDGELYTEESSISPVRDQAGKITNFVALKNDITRTLKLEEQLFLSEKMTTIAGLAAGVAHEINTPLSAILQSIQVIQTIFALDRADNRKLAEECGVDLEKIRQYMERQEVIFFMDAIKESAINASRIINSLLDFSRPQQSEMKMADINQLVTNSLTLARADYDLKRKYDIINVEICSELADDLPVIECVPMEIEQVFLNLLKNAIHAIADSKHGAKGKIVIKSMQDGDFVRVEIEDNGPGISPEIKKRIFDPFFTTKDVGIGTGLGLSVSYAIIREKHEGRIWADSEEGKGAKFSIMLPVQQQA